MAIQVDLVQSQYGVPFQGAYFRISNIHVVRINASFLKFNTIIDVFGYAAPPEDSSVREIESRRYVVPFSQIDAQDGENFIAKCYFWVMAQPDMSGSIAV